MRKTQIQNSLQTHRSKLESFKSNTTKLKEQDIQCLQIHPLYRMDRKNTGVHNDLTENKGGRVGQ